MTAQRAAYAALLVAAAFYFAVANNRESLVLLVVVVMLLAADAIMALIARRTMRVTLDMPRTCTRGAMLDLTVDVDLPKPVVYGMLSLRVVITNRLLGATRSILLKSAFKKLGGSNKKICVDARHCGAITVSCDGGTVTGPFGLISLPISLNDQHELLTYPQKKDLAVILASSPQAQLSSYTYDNRKGSDPTEIFDIRDYADGDSLSTVHWKLSAKAGSLVVREASRPTGFDTLVLLDTFSDSDMETVGGDQADDVFALARSISAEQAADGLAHDFAFPNGDHLEVCQVETPVQTTQALELALRVPLPQDPGHGLELLLRSLTFEYTKVICVASSLSRAAAMELSSQCDLSVVNVSRSSKSVSTESGPYSIVTIPVGSFMREIRSVTV
ncbi:MAG: DUF58 domain-containing protein [Coriobacteriia bacterium]|nr:DUF58 domain-containing protein [Coriobacteriia bacterium]